MRRTSLLEQIYKPINIIRYRDITITNNESSVLSDFQVPIEIGGDFLDKANPNNLIITDSNDVILPYWIEEWKRPNGKAKIWIKLDLPASGSKILKLYYQGIIGDNSSNGDDVFLFFDDFDGNNLNTDKWSKSSELNLTFSNSEIRFLSNSSTYYGLWTNENFPKSLNVVTEVLMRVENYSGENFRFRHRTDVTNDKGIDFVHGNNWRVDYRDTGSWTVLGNLTGQQNYKFAPQKLRIEKRSELLYYMKIFERKETTWEESSSLSYTFDPSSIADTFRIQFYYNNVSGWVKMDYILMYKYISNEPTVSVSSEKVIARGF